MSSLRKIFSFVSVLALSAAVEAAPTPTQVSLTKYDSARQGGRVVFKTSAQVKPKLFTLSNPDRLVIDFDASQLSPVSQPAASHPLFAKARTAGRDNGGVRVVLDLKAPVALKTSQQGSSLIIEAMSKNLNLGKATQTTETPKLVEKDAKSLAEKQGKAKAAEIKPVKENAVESKPEAVLITTSADKALNKVNKDQQQASDPRLKGKDVVASLEANKITDETESEAQDIAIQAKPSYSSDKGRDVIVAIDAGHGGKDIGAQGVGGTQEKDVVYAIAKRLANLVNNQIGMTAVMVRQGDNFVGLDERRRIAKSARADLFISIHADAFSDPQTQGASVYTLSHRGASSKDARWLASSENAADSNSRGDKDDMLNTVLMDLTQTAAREASLNAGSHVLKQLKNVGPLHRSTVQKAGFVVLKSPDIPSILIETAYISNPEEEHKLRSASYQEKMATAIFGGINTHFRRYAPADTLLAANASSKAKRAKVSSTVTVQKSTAPVTPDSSNIMRVAQRPSGNGKAVKMVTTAKFDKARLGQVL